MLDFCSCVWPWLLSVWMWMEENISAFLKIRRKGRRKRSWLNCCSVYQLQKCSVRVWSFVYAHWHCQRQVKFFTAENESSRKPAVLLDTPLIVIADLLHRYLEYFIQDIDGYVFDRVNAHSQTFARFVAAEGWAISRSNSYVMHHHFKSEWKLICYIKRLN